MTLAGAIFIAPFFLLSALGGQLADRYDKAAVAQKLKFTEIGAAAVAVAGFLLQSVAILFIALLLFGSLAALFTPTKYGLLPDHLETHELAAGNALVEARDLPRHPRRDDRRRHRRGARHRAGPFRRPGDGLRRPLLAGRPPDSAERGGRAASEDRSEHLSIDLGAVAPSLGRRRDLAREPPRQLVLDRRRGPLRAPADPGEGHTWRRRSRGHRLSRPVRRRHSSRFGARGLAFGRADHPPAGARRDRRHGPFHARPRLRRRKRGSRRGRHRHQDVSLVRYRLLTSRSISSASPSPPGS